jgi:hypothetical protein
MLSGSGNGFSLPITLESSGKVEFFSNKAGVKKPARGQMGAQFSNRFATI